MVGQFAAATSISTSVQNLPKLGPCLATFPKNNCTISATNMIKNIDIWITWNMIDNMIDFDYLIHVYYLFYIYTEVPSLQNSVNFQKIRPVTCHSDSKNS